MLNLRKGDQIDLSKHAPSLRHAVIGLGWTERSTNGSVFDLDASVVLVGPDGKAGKDEDFVFYNNLDGGNGSVHHTGDDRTGGDGNNDDEQILVDLERVPADVAAIHILVSIDRAEQRGQNFGQVSTSYVRIFDSADGNDDDQVRFDLTEDSATATTMQFGVLERTGRGWTFHADTRNFTDLSQAVRNFGLLA